MEMGRPTQGPQATTEQCMPFNYVQTVQDMAEDRGIDFDVPVVQAMAELRLAREDQKAYLRDMNSFRASVRSIMNTRVSGKKISQWMDISDEGQSLSEMIPEEDLAVHRSALESTLESAADQLIAATGNAKSSTMYGGLMDTLRELATVGVRPKHYMPIGSKVEVLRMPWRLHIATHDFLKLVEQLGFNDLANRVRTQQYLTEVRSMYMADILQAIYDANQDICGDDARKALSRECQELAEGVDLEDHIICQPLSGVDLACNKIKEIDRMMEAPEESTIASVVSLIETRYNADECTFTPESPVRNNFGDACQNMARMLNDLGSLEDQIEIFLL